jgi:hypothetical protein
MDTLIWIIAAVAALWYLARLVAMVRHDGLGDHPAPPSHLDWSDTADNLPSHRF